MSSGSWWWKYFLCCLACHVWAQDISIAQKHNILRLEQKISKTRARIQELRMFEHKHLNELREIRKDSLIERSQPDHVTVKHDLRSLADKATQRFSTDDYFFKFSRFDDQYSLTFHGLLEVDNDTFANFSGLTLNDGIRSIPIINQNTVNRFWVNRARPFVEGNIKKIINFYINPDFGQSQQRLFDGFVSIHYWRALGVKIGKQTSLVAGVENYVMSSVYHTLQPGFTTILAPNREIGLVLFGSIGPYRPKSYNIWLSPFGFDDWLSYQLGMLGGTADGTNPGLNPINILEFTTQSSTLANKAFEGRVLVNPFINLTDSWLESLAIAFSGSSQIVHNEGFMPALVSPGLNPIFVYQSAVIGNGPRTRIHPTIFWHYRKFGMLLDATQTVQHVAANNLQPIAIVPKVEQINRALQVQFTYNLTSEDYRYLNLKPERDFKFFEKGAIGAWQVVLQHGWLWMDSSVFQDYNISGDQKKYVYSDPRISIQNASTWTVTLNWYWNKNFRISTEFDQTVFLGGCSTGGLNAPVHPGCLTADPQYINRVDSQVLDRPTEKLILERIQLYF